MSEKMDGPKYTSETIRQSPADNTMNGDQEDFPKMRTTSIPYAGRLGGNQEFVVDPTDPDNRSLLEKSPDAATNTSIRDLLSLEGFKQPQLWKQAIMEGIGTLLLVYLTVLLAISPPLNIQSSPIPSGPAGIFGTASFIAPTVGTIVTMLAIPLFIFLWGAVSGGHLNPMLTIATFLCRLTTLPRMVLYVGFQIVGAVLAGLLARASMNSHEWKVGACFFDPNLVETRQMFTTEFTCSLAVIFLAFGVGLDPRQASTFGPALAPILVGVAIGLCGYATSFTIPGYGGAGLNPARCLAVWIGSGHSLGVTGANVELGFDGPNGDRLWVYWIGPIAAGITHAVFYQLVPPWSFSGVGSTEVNVDNTRRTGRKAQVVDSHRP